MVSMLAKKTSQKPEEHVSAGGLVYRVEEGTTHVILISRLGGKVWCLPKGHVEGRETLEQAAVREVKEETGVEANVVQKLGDVQYAYYDKWEKKKIFKTVYFFLLLYRAGHVENHDREVDEARWFSIHEALSFLSYASEKQVFQEAVKVLALEK